MRTEIKELYDYLEQCDDELTIHEKQLMNLKILHIAEKYLSQTKNKDIIDIYHQAHHYWQTLDKQVNLDELDDHAWELNNKLFGIRYGHHIDGILLRFLLGTTEKNSDKDYFDQLFDFYDSLINRAEKLGK
ncbi:hypothetical protein [Bergeriella denitrificans]|uniref:Uncharacterized protein n=1 Tax=Bergeriella denitrificans TaxID=494 RepID=A0A378UIU0_BERDE|nr:hypothetical protein [Bergeriella denitrificans]STZ76609.1 Uncharacterised protein [Bergeriella denitrificans]